MYVCACEGLHNITRYNNAQCKKLYMYVWTAPSLPADWLADKWPCCCCCCPIPVATCAKWFKCHNKMEHTCHAHIHTHIHTHTQTPTSIYILYMCTVCGGGEKKGNNSQWPPRQEQWQAVWATLASNCLRQAIIIRPCQSLTMSVP